MQTVTKNCKNCKTSFTITYYLTVADEATDICNRCWNKRVSKNWATTRGSDKKNYLANSYSDGFNTYYSSKPVAKPKSGISLYLDNLIPNSQLKNNKNNKNNKNKKAKEREQKNNSKRIVESPNIPWLANHNNGAKEPLMNSGLEFNVDSLINKLKGA